MPKKQPAAPAPETDKGEVKDITLVYLGRAERGGYRWLHLADNAPDGRAWGIYLRGLHDPIADSSAWVWQKQLKTCKPGAVYRFKGHIYGDEQVSLYTPKTGERAPEFLGVWNNSAQRHKWVIADEIVGDLKAAQSKAAQAQNSGLPLDALEPFRAAYQRGSEQDRRLILAMVIAEITRIKPSNK